MTLSDAVKILEEAGVDSPLYDARELFKRYVHGAVFLNTECNDERLLSDIKRRADREPLQYIIGEVGFYRESYLVSPDCLIPRSDTELLVDYAVKNIPEGESFIDLCTGSGCVAISTLKNTKNTTAIALDISEGALEVARKNAKRNGVEKRIEFISADALAEPMCDRVFALLSNPPYVSEAAYLTLEKEIYREPRIAFVGGEDGCDFYRRITRLYRDRIDKNGFIAYEIGYDQAELLTEIAKENSMSCRIFKDLSGNDRLAVLQIE